MFFFVFLIYIGNSVSMIVVNVSKWVAKTEVERSEKAAFSPAWGNGKFKPSIYFFSGFGTYNGFGQLFRYSLGRLESLT